MKKEEQRQEEKKKLKNEWTNAQMKTNCKDDINHTGIQSPLATRAHTQSLLLCTYAYLCVKLWNVSLFLSVARVMFNTLAIDRKLWFFFVQMHFSFVYFFLCFNIRQSFSCCYVVGCRAAIVNLWIWHNSQQCFFTRSERKKKRNALACVCNWIGQKETTNWRLLNNKVFFKS